MEKQKYSREDLFNLGPQRTYFGKYLNEISFPLGGIGTGSIGLNGRGGLIDFEIFNRPNVGSIFPKTFPLVRIKEENKAPETKVLLGPVQRPYTRLHGGRYVARAEGFPHMDEVKFTGKYPFAHVEFISQDFPVLVELEAYNPFIPSDPDASSIPIAILKYSITNPTDSPIEASVLWSLLNIVGFTKEDSIKNMIYGFHEPSGQFNNLSINEGGVSGVLLSNFSYDEMHPQFGSMALVTPDIEDASKTSYWKAGPWFTSEYTIWNYFKENGCLKEFKGGKFQKPEACALSIKKRVPPGETKDFTFYITWYFPNFAKYGTGWTEDKPMEEWHTWKNYYASIYEDALDVAIQYNKEHKRYYQDSKKFRGALFSSSLPPYVIDAIAGNMAILKTTTCIRLSDGSFYGFEGCHPTAGCCEGSCTHVWSYQQTLPFLFPSLERSMEDLNYKYNFIFDDFGALEFRIQLPLGRQHASFKPCADGQMGGVMHVYREWKISGDDDWLKSIWPRVKLALEFAWEEWDADKTGVLGSFQHNTYDIDFYGPNSMLTSIYLGALKAGGEMAKHVGDEVAAKQYMVLHDKGRKWVDENLFDGEYYIQKYFPEKAKDYQVGDGCLIDQVFGQELAMVAGLGRFLDPIHLKTALKHIFTYNWKPNMKNHENGARLYAVNNEAGVIMCTWPKGGRPDIPFPYADEVMDGFEYQFATHCIYEGLIEEGLTVVKSIRDRYDGYGRNPWNEIECGHHYARSMAAYGLLIALSGFEYDKGKGYLGFSPVLYEGEFQCFWSLEGVWGIFRQEDSRCIIKVLYGCIELHKVKLSILSEKNVTVSIENGVNTSQNKADSKGMIIFERPVVLNCDGDHVLVLESKS